MLRALFASLLLLGSSSGGPAETSNVLAPEVSLIQGGEDTCAAAFILNGDCPIGCIFEDGNCFLDSCKTSPCAVMTPHSECKNVVGGYVCSCIDMYFNVSECTHQQCSNAQGGHTCNCYSSVNYTGSNRPVCAGKCNCDNPPGLRAHIQCETSDGFDCCPAGYHRNMRDTQFCTVDCTCQNGKPKDPNTCFTGGEHCDTCDYGYRMLGPICVPLLGPQELQGNCDPPPPNVTEPNTTATVKRVEMKIIYTNASADDSSNASNASTTITTEQQLISDVESEVKQPSVAIDDYSAAAGYTNDLNISWLVNCLENKCPVYDFVSFDIRSGIDKVYITDGPDNADSAKIFMQPLLGGADTDGFGLVGQAMKSNMTLNFVTGLGNVTEAVGAVDGKGFNMTFTCLPCGTSPLPATAAARDDCNNTTFGPVLVYEFSSPLMVNTSTIFPGTWGIYINYKAKTPRFEAYPLLLTDGVWTAAAGPITGGGPPDYWVQAAAEHATLMSKGEQTVSWTVCGDDRSMLEWDWKLPSESPTPSPSVTPSISASNIPPSFIYPFTTCPQLNCSKCTGTGPEQCVECSDGSMAQDGKCMHVYIPDPCPQADCVFCDGPRSNDCIGTCTDGSLVRTPGNCDHVAANRKPDVVLLTNGVPSMSSAMEWNPPALGVDGTDLYASSLPTDAYPWFQLGFAKTHRIYTITYKNRNDDKACRMFEATHDCSWETSNSTFDGLQQGATFGVSMRPCSDDACDGTVCQKVVTPLSGDEADLSYTIDCDSANGGVLGKYVYVQLQGETRVLNVVEMQAEGYEVPDAPEVALDQYSESGNMVESRIQFDVATLKDGRVIACGGFVYDASGSGSAVSTCEVFDPDAGTWSADFASMTKPRIGHSMTTLTDGRVLAAGGWLTDAEPDALLNVELYDPATQEWTNSDQPGGPPPLPYGPSSSQLEKIQVTAMSDNRVLVAGGKQFTGGSKTTPFHSTQTVMWHPDWRYPRYSGQTNGTTPMLTERADFALASVEGGAVAIGGQSASSGSDEEKYAGSATAEVFYDGDGNATNFVSGTWEYVSGATNEAQACTLASLCYQLGSRNSWPCLHGPAATTLSNGYVMTLTGKGLSRVEPTVSTTIYEPKARTWHSVSNPPYYNSEGNSEIESARIAALLDGRAVIMGGFNMAYEISKRTYIYSGAPDPLPFCK